MTPHPPTPPEVNGTCRESVTIGGDVADCTLRAGHLSKHQFRWVGEASWFGRTAVQWAAAFSDEHQAREHAEQRVAALERVIATHNCLSKATWCGAHKVFHDSPYPELPAICAIVTPPTGGRT